MIKIQTQNVAREVKIKIQHIVDINQNKMPEKVKNFTP